MAHSPGAAPSSVPLLMSPAVVAPGVLNVLSAGPVVLTHLWQEYHKDAPTTKYVGPTVDDQRVVEHPDLLGELQRKPNLHLCFLERAVVTIEADVAAGTTLFAKWQILDSSGAVVREHARFSQANYAANAAAARLPVHTVNTGSSSTVAPGHFGWMWDGRDRPGRAAGSVLLAAGTYTSRVTIKDASGNQLEQSDATIELQGTPYRIFIVGEPKNDTDLRAEMARPENNGRLLTAGGERIGRDCWLKVFRGEQNDGHVCHLGQGTIEATKAEVGNGMGAIATPHGREYKGWVRVDPHGDATAADRIQVEDVGRTDQTIQLTNPGGPPPNNPYSDTAPNTPVKDGVQAHQGAAQTTNGLSVGCTTACRINNATLVSPGSVAGRVRSINSEFGTWGGAINIEGPLFVNKQTKRDNPADALINDSHASPELDPPQHPPVTGRFDEPLHMQPTVQRAAFGGFLGNEIPRSGNVVDEPVNQLRIRLMLGAYAPGSMYYAYHHALVFGHAWEPDGNAFRVTAWIPRKIIRGWNGNHRNVLVRGRCQIAWYVEHRLPPNVAGAAAVVHALHAGGGAQGSDFVALPNGSVGRAQETWTPVQPLAAGEYVSVFRYRLEMRPFTAGQDDWVPEPAATDPFVAPGTAGIGGARLAAETLVTQGNQAFLEGRSELLITTV